METLGLGAATAITTNTNWARYFETGDCDLYLNAAGSKIGNASGNLWHSVTWKSINSYNF